MALTLKDWHRRFLVQAQWTKSLRSYLFDLLRTSPADKILDMGCGTGALLTDLGSLSPAEIFGADLSHESVELAATVCPECNLTTADVHQLPYANDSFEIVLTHYFLMWVANPAKALAEMLRVTKSGGFLICFAEPDYGGRLDYPLEFISLRDYQISGLLQAGADPRMGRKLKSLFHQSGLSDVHSGVYEGSWQGLQSAEELETEWQVLENDLAGILTARELNELKKHDQASREKGSRMIYVPTFYAWGKINK
jgi:SAM-dependent methyltransferase